MHRIWRHQVYCKFTAQVIHCSYGLVILCVFFFLSVSNAENDISRILGVVCMDLVRHRSTKGLFSRIKRWVIVFSEHKVGDEVMYWAEIKSDFSIL